MSADHKTYVVAYIDFLDNVMKMRQVTGVGTEHRALAEGLVMLEVIHKDDPVYSMDEVAFMQDEMFNRDAICGVLEVLST